MMVLRRRVRLWVMAWLFVQAASLSAFAPRDCCASHREAVETPDCHETPKVTHCPMRAPDGTPCPRHRGEASVHEDHESSATRDCVISGTCQSPSVFTVFSNAGILPDSPSTIVHLHPPTRSPEVREAPVSRTCPPDPPPPRH